MLVGRLPLDSYASVKKAEKTKVLYGPSYQNYMAFFNTTRPPLDNVKVRKALAHAIPYNDIVTIGFDGNASQARGPVPQGQFGGTKDVIQYEQDLELAKKLLAEAGHPNGGFKLTLTYAAENAQEARFAPLIQSELKKIPRQPRIFSCCSGGRPTAIPMKPFTPFSMTRETNRSGILPIIRTRPMTKRSERPMRRLVPTLTRPLIST